MKTKVFIRFAAVGVIALACGIWFGRQSFKGDEISVNGGTPDRRVPEERLMLSRLPEAISSALKQPIRSHSSQALKNAAHAVADEDIVGALDLADTIAELQLRARFRHVLLARWAAKDPMAAMNYAAAIADPAQRHAAMLAVLEVWMTRDQTAATAWVRALPDSALRRAALQAAIAALSAQDISAA